MYSNKFQIFLSALDMEACMDQCQVWKLFQPMERYFCCFKCLNIFSQIYYLSNISNSNIAKKILLKNNYLLVISTIIIAFVIVIIIAIAIFCYSFQLLLQLSLLLSCFLSLLLIIIIYVYVYEQVKVIKIEVLKLNCIFI